MPYPEHITSLLADMEAEAERVSRETDDHWVRARSLKPASARLLHVLACATGAQRILEIGTSVGYSTVHLALAAQETGGHVATLELMPAKYDQAQANLARGGLTPSVTQHLGDALVVLETLAGPWDLVFVDAEKDVYLAAWRLFADHVRPGGLVIADNVISHAEGLAGYLAAVRADGRYRTETVALERGLELSYRRR